MLIKVFHKISFEFRLTVYSHLDHLETAMIEKQEFHNFHQSVINLLFFLLSPDTRLISFREGVLRMRTLSCARKTFLQMIIFTVLEKLPLRKIAPSPNSNANPKPNPDPDGLGGNFSRGQYSGHNIYKYHQLLNLLNLLNCLKLWSSWWWYSYAIAETATSVLWKRYS